MEPEELKKNSSPLWPARLRMQTVPPCRPPPALGGPRPAASTKNLDQYTIEQTSAAKEGNDRPGLGRDFAIRQIIDS